MVRSSVTSRKLTTFLFALMVMRRLCLANTLQISFLMLSILFGGGGGGVGQELLSSHL